MDSHSFSFRQAITADQKLVVLPMCRCSAADVPALQINLFKRGNCWKTSVLTLQSETSIARAVMCWLIATGSERCLISSPWVAKGVSQREHFFWSGGRQLGVELRCILTWKQRDKVRIFNYTYNKLNSNRICSSCFSFYEFDEGLFWTLSGWAFTLSFWSSSVWLR